MSRLVCELCPHSCSLEEGQAGLCRARRNQDGAIRDENYGLITSLALDPIEKKPLYRFYPGSKILSVGSYGCNFRCSFCQNYEISMSGRERVEPVYILPEELIHKAIELKPMGNIGIAYTYNEPLIGIEYVFDCAKLAKEKGLKNVLVTNGYINQKPLIKMLPWIDAMNIDLKAFSEPFYKKIGGGLETVKKTIAHASKSCHVEVTTLIIPGENDTPEEMLKLSHWLSCVNHEIPLHITRFFPRYRMTDRNATDVTVIYELAAIARKNLKYVYTGNCG
ncbi:MAG: AmmeMemoRadiSam system radical SAM enzyme [Clostridiales bacterium]|nr:AmmeMemoRadiSam system radical SAM enzyme [Clostridiales bacterium]